MKTDLSTFKTKAETGNAQPPQEPQSHRLKQLKEGLPLKPSAQTLDLKTGK